MNRNDIKDEDLVALHQLLTDAYKNELQRAEKDGEVPATLLTSIANFLKHNGIACSASGGDKDHPLTALQERAQEALGYPYPTRDDQ